MSATEPLSYLMGVRVPHLSFHERKYLDASLFLLVVAELKLHFKRQHHYYLKLLKSNAHKEQVMLDADFTREIVKDILLTQEYSIDGIARYANTYTDVVYDIALGHNINPSAAFLQQLIALHLSVKPNLYRSLFKKILVDIKEEEA